MLLLLIACGGLAVLVRGRGGSHREAGNEGALSR